jgi:hypothetical protein
MYIDFAENEEGEDNTQALDVKFDIRERGEPVLPLIPKGSYSLDFKKNLLRRFVKAVRSE